MKEIDQFLFSVLFILGILAIASLFKDKPSTVQSTPVPNTVELEALRQQCKRLRDELNQQATQLTTDFRSSTFEQLQTLLTNYPTSKKIIQIKPDLPAKNLISLFTSLDNLLQEWGYETIGIPWEQVPYNPQIHQPDMEDIQPEELVYIRFVGYREGEQILCPAKVSRTLPGGIKS